MPKSRPFSIAFDLSFAEAIAQARSRGAVLPDEFYNKLQAEARTQAFSVSGLTSLEQIQSVLDGLTQAIETGQTFGEWQKAASADLGTLTPWRRETIFRTGVQTAYNVGRTVQQRENAGRRPYYMWDAINDSRTRPAHHAMSGYIAPISDPIWSRWSPPAGFNCRCTRITLTAAQASARGYGSKEQPDVQPDDGWGYEKADYQGAMLEKLLLEKVAVMPRVIQDAWHYFVEALAILIAAKVAEGMTQSEAEQEVFGGG